ncbi:MAG: sulfite exporter TauE/SafE family protein [Legionellaceae bacterium]|nr:sulfite exporter TauE/SafE family protein [Legionellaceae bacterium]
MAGLVTGLMSGLLGLGGGVIVVPALFFIFKGYAGFPDDLCMHLAAGSSLGAMIGTSLASIHAHYRLSPILWDEYSRLKIGIILGTFVGAGLAGFLSSMWLKIFFGCFLLFVAYKMFRSVHVFSHTKKMPVWVDRIVSFLIGFKSGLLGVGGGALIIPYLTYCGVPPRSIAPISSLCTLTVSIIGTCVFTLTGLSVLGLPPWATGYVYWPAVLFVAIPSIIAAPWGARLNYSVPISQLRLTFVIILCIIAFNMLYSALR